MITVGERVHLRRSARNDSGRPVAERSNEEYMLKRLVKFAQELKKEGVERYTIDMDISELGTVYKLMASLLDLRLPHAPSVARRTPDRLQLIAPRKLRDRRPTWKEIVKIFEWLAEHPQREQAVSDVIRIADQMCIPAWRTVSLDVVGSRRRATARASPQSQTSTTEEWQR